MTALAPRALGAVRVSPLAFGSMRLDERGLDDAAWEALLREAIERGVTTLHSSSEYESYPRFCGLVARLRGLPIQHIVKLADPHFGELGFDAARFEARVDAYLAGLGAERLDVVQWMWRGDLKRESDRRTGLDWDRGAIRAAFDALRAKGKLGAVATFPYTAGFADRLIGGPGGPLGEGLAVYLNPAEREMLPQIRAAARAGMGTVAIRPLAAGHALAGATAAACVRGVLAEPGVATAVVTFSSRAHLGDLLDGAA
jgi:aryl-alcohol dehydrogenase-like predicted oxidoreductase